MEGKVTNIYLDSWNNPVDLESLNSCAGNLEFDSIKSAVCFILDQPIFDLIDGEFVKIKPTYHSIQKKIKKYGYFKAYGFVNNYFLSFMIK